MTALTVSATADFSNALISNIDTIRFTNIFIIDPPATATFSGAQFDNVRIDEDVLIDGSGGINSIVVNAAGVFAANIWSFLDWSGNDNITINGSAGNDTLGGSSMRDTINAGFGNDNINGQGGNDILNGGDGDDQFFVAEGSGSDRIDGGGGTDFVHLRRIGSAVNYSISLAGFGGGGGGGADIGDGTRLTSIERLTFEGGSGNDGVTGGSLADVLLGNDGDDALDGMSGDDTLDGGAGNDTLTGSAGNDTIAGGSGNDTIRDLGNGLATGPDNNDKMYGGDGDDQIISSGGADVIDGGAGIDQVTLSRHPFAAALTVSLYHGGGGVDIGDGTKLTGIERLAFVGGSGDDKIFGGLLADTIDGGGGNDVLTGNGGGDTLLGGDGDDAITLNGAAGPAIVDGGAGTDSAIIYRSQSAAGLDINISAGGDGLDIGDGATLAGIEILEFYGGSGNDSVTGGWLDDLVLGGGGDDTISGLGGADDLVGGDGDDVLLGGDGGDSLDGREGNDTLLGGAGDDYLYGFSGADYLSGDAGDDVIYSLDGGGGNSDTIEGGLDIDLLFLDRTSWLGGVVLDISNGGGGNGIGDGTTVSGIERLDFKGGAGNDRVTGGALGDHLEGQGGNDVLRGRGGIDALIGGLGRDTLAGGGGGDVFVFEAAADSPAGTGRDTVTDFQKGLDRIGLNGAVATAFIGSQAFHGIAGEFRYAKNAVKDFTTLSLDSDGDRGADLQVRFLGLVDFAENDFDLL